MKRVILILATAISLGINADAQFGGKKVKEITVIPDNAKISIGGTEVGTGTYQLTMTKKQDFVVLKLEAEGYLTKTVKIFKTDKTNTYSYKLEEDKAYLASTNSTDVANKPMKVVVKKGMSKAEAWKRVIYYVTENFETLEINDSNAGWIRTAWEWDEFNRVVIRTRVEVKEVIGQDDEVVYRITLSSQSALKSCGRDDQCFHPWDRLLKKYDTMIKDLQNSLN